MTADDGDGGISGLGAGDLRQESGSTDDVKGGDTEEAPGVENTSLLERSSNDGDGRVDGVGDDQDVCLGGNASDSGSQVANNGGVGLLSAG